MKNLSYSEKYTLAAVVVLAAVVWLDQPLATIPVGIAGVAIGAWIAQREKLRRAAVLALVAFSLSIVFAATALLR